MKTLFLELPVGGKFTSLRNTDDLWLQNRASAKLKQIAVEGRRCKKNAEAHTLRLLLSRASLGRRPFDSLWHCKCWWEYGCDNLGFKRSVHSQPRDLDVQSWSELSVWVALRRRLRRLLLIGDPLGECDPCKPTFERKEPWVPGALF